MFKKQYNILKQGFKDIFAFLNFRKDIKQEIANNLSQFNKYELNTNKIGNIVYKLIDLPENYEKFGDDIQKYQYLMDICRPINFYFENFLNWGEYLIFNLYHYEDTENKDAIVYTYLAQWEFIPLCLNRFVWYRNIIITTGLLGFGIFAIIKWLLPLLII